MGAHFALSSENHRPLSLDDVYRAFLASIGPSSRPAEQRFAERLRRHPEVLALRLARVRRVVELLGGEGGVLLDAGAGTAINAVLSLVAGAAEVHAVELNPVRFEIARQLVERLGLERRLHLVTEDILTLELPPASLDGIYSNEFLEHVVDSPAYHRRAAEWLVPGGRVYGRTGANGANWLYQRTYGRMWQRADETTYAPQRREILLSLAPKLDPEVIARLVAATRGASAAEIEAALAAYDESGKLPPPSGRVPKNPRTGVYHERLRWPRELLAEMAAAGLHGRVVRPDFRFTFDPAPWRRRFYRSLGALIAWGHPLSLPISPWLEVMGEKA